MRLKTFQEFRSSIKQLSAFQAIRQKDRRRFLSDAYKLAKDKYEKERWLETAPGASKSSRASSTQKLLRAAQHIRNALVEIDKAKAAAPTDPPKLMHHLQVDKASDPLRAAYDDLGFLIGMDISAVHPHHRTDFEKRFRAAYPNEFLKKVEKNYSEMPTRRSRIDYQLAAALSSRLDKCKTSTGRSMRPIDRYRIISRVFLAALEQTYPKATVKTALDRTLGQRSPV